MAPQPPGHPVAEAEGTIDMLELETRLRQDADGDHRRQILARIEEMQATLRRRLEAGAPPAEFQRLARIARACDTAAELMASATLRGAPIVGGY